MPSLHAPPPDRFVRLPGDVSFKHPEAIAPCRSSKHVRDHTLQTLRYLQIVAMRSGHQRHHVRIAHTLVNSILEV